MVKKEKATSVYGLIGKNISYSFSKDYFNKKFATLNLEGLQYKNFDFENIEDVEFFVKNIPSEIKGLNVTIPYKEAVMPFLDEISEDAQIIGAVNCIEIDATGKKIGHNTDWIGFTKSIQPFLKDRKIKAMILGTGGASKAIQYALKKMEIPYFIVSRTRTAAFLKTYETIEEEEIQTNQLIINCTPLGTYPNIQNCPEIPFKYLNEQNIVFDLVYNPPMTLMLKKSASQGAIIKNGYEMLTIQAEENWQIWSKEYPLATF